MCHLQKTVHPLRVVLTLENQPRETALFPSHFLQPVWVCVARMKHHDQKPLERLIWLTYPKLTSTEGRKQTQELLLLLLLAGLLGLLSYRTQDPHPWCGPPTRNRLSSYSYPYLRWISF